LRGRDGPKPPPLETRQDGSVEGTDPDFCFEEVTEPEDRHRVFRHRLRWRGSGTGSRKAKTAISELFFVTSKDNKVSL
jgi:hypothetical protein